VVKIRRGKLELYIDVLQNIKSGHILKTNIMIESKLSYNQIKEILEDLELNGLIHKASNHKDNRIDSEYSITHKGTKALSLLVTGINLLGF
jgi:predicted transcriptional regulator